MLAAAFPLSIFNLTFFELMSEFNKFFNLTISLSGHMIPEHQSERSPKDLRVYKWKAFLTIALGTTMGAMDMSITNISFPILTEVFKAELATIMWVALSFSLVNTSLMLILGKISDLMGRKKIYTTGMAIFTLGLIACSLAQSLGPDRHSKECRALAGDGSCRNRFLRKKDYTPGGT